MSIHQLMPRYKIHHSRILVASLLYILLFSASVALSLRYEHNSVLKTMRDPFATLFVGAVPAQFTGGQLLWLFLWVGYMLLPVVLSVGVTERFQHTLFFHVNVRFKPRILTYLWPLKQLLLNQLRLWLLMVVTTIIAGYFIWPSQQAFSQALFDLGVILGQLCILLIEFMTEGLFGEEVGCLTAVVFIVMSFTQVPFMPLRYTIASAAPTNLQLLSANGYLILLLLVILGIQLIMVPGRWRQNGK